MMKMERAGPMGDMASPLKHFTNAKKKINNIFSDIASYIEEFGEFIDDVGNSDENLIIDEELEDEILAALNQVGGIKDMISRNHMKVVFFGRTSNGKSSVINAMLWDKILPSGIGHTTNCFLSVAGSDEENPGSEQADDGAYLLCGQSNERRSIKSVSQLGHALSQESLSYDSLIQVFWPKKKCALLKDEVVLLDSPGIDVSNDLDQWIDNYCLDADVFILVANAESTLMLAEKNFFHKVNEKLSKPNIFILNNRWDASASEPETMEEVRQQHLERGIAFLADELKVVSKQQAKDRVFFVSAKETLQSRINKLQGKADSTSNMADGYKARLMEFAHFEREFEECISRSATRTKFEYHAQRASKIIDTLYSRAEWLHNRATDLLKDCVERQMFLQQRVEYIDKQLSIITADAKQNITLLSNEAERQVRTAMTDEIRRLPLLVDEFQRPFHPNPMVLRVYKAELYHHVEDGLGRNLSARCSAALQRQIDRNRGDMIDVVKPLLVLPETNDDDGSSSVDNDMLQPDPSRFRSLVRSASQLPSFDISYDIDCASLCADFQEDIEFKFSLGFNQLMARFIGPRDARRVRLGGLTPDPAVAAASSTKPATVYHPGLPVDHVGLHGNVQPYPAEDLLYSLASGYMKFTNSHSAMFVAGLGMVPYLFWRTIGWRAVAFAAASYGTLYAYERLTWTSRAKERALKRQFVEHASDKLNLVISFTSTNCSHQVQQELSGTLAQLCTDVDEVRLDIQNECENLIAQHKHLVKAQTRSKTLRNKAGWLASELDTFTKSYLVTAPAYNGNGAT
uniref:Mitofusin-2 n=1 Tax=Phallusia mammillata TaxID=59560 RepID=A0A6F9DKX6_9ASCI|nr:mitofusin-2 [Phallusia mammillata]